MPSSRPSKLLALLSIYAIVVTIALSHRFVRDVSSQLREANSVAQDEFAYYESNFLPSSSSSSSSSSSARGGNNATGSPTRPASTVADRPVGKLFPVRNHIVTQGRPRTATTLLYNMVAASYFLYLIENDPSRIPAVELSYWQRPKGRKVLRKERNATHVLKTHVTLDNFLTEKAVVFAAAGSREEARTMRRELEGGGHLVAFVQDMESLKEGGVAGLVREYVKGYGLSEEGGGHLEEYFAKWEILRQCCGQQMSVKWRNDLYPEKFKIPQYGTHPTCATHDIDVVERDFMNTALYAMIDMHPSVRPLNKPSLNDDALNGTYCSSYNHLVRTLGLSIWGQPGGRPRRSNLDSAIKDQLKEGREGMKPEGLLRFFPDTNETRSQRLRKMYALPEEEKKEWLRGVLAAREEGGKRYEDYDVTTSAASGDGEGGPDDVEGESGEVTNSAEKKESKDGSDGSASDGAATPGAPHQIAHTGSVDAANAELSNLKFDDSRAIFLISFGEEAARSTLVERCVLSLRRRGSFGGYVVVLTDAPPSRYANVWDDRVIVMRPREEHLNATAEDGSTPLKFTRENRSLKSKRFKTFAVEYVDSDERLDSVELIYYLDIDVMAGNSLGDLFDGVEGKYEVSREERGEGTASSRLYFFTPLNAKEWPLQGGTFIVERRSSGRCLELWRREIDLLTASGRGRDQDALRTVHRRIEAGDETGCRLVQMENENFVSFPTPRTWDKMARQEVRPNLVHISNSVFAKWIDEDAQNEYIHGLLRLSEEERISGRYGKVTVSSLKSDM